MLSFGLESWRKHEYVERDVFYQFVFYIEYLLLFVIEYLMLAAHQQLLSENA